MADQIGVDIVANDQQFIASSNKAAAAVNALADQEAKLGKAAADAGVDKKKFSQQFAKVEAERIRDSKKAQKLKDQAEKSAAKAVEDADNKREAAGKRLARVLLGRRALILGESVGIGAAGVAAIELTAAFVTGGIAVAALLAGVAALAEKTREARVESQGVLDTLTNGRGAEALKLVDGLADDLGIKLQDARDEFIKFRQAGLDNGQSADLIKLRADLIAVGKGAKEADEAVSIVLAQKGGSGTEAQIKHLADQAHVAGDGAASAAAKYETLHGALNRLDNSKVEALQKIGDKIQPALDRAAQAVASMVDNLLKSKDGEKIIDDVAGAITRMADVITDTTPKAEALIKALSDKDALGTGKTAWGEVKSAIVEVGSAAWEIPKAFWIVAQNINDAVNYIATPFEDLGIRIGKTAARWAVDAYDWGKNVVEGLVNGITGSFGRAEDAIVNLGHRISHAFTGKLEMHSPSKLFERHGFNTGRGYEIGVERAMPTGDEIAQRALPRPAIFNREPVERAEPNPAIFNREQPPVFGRAQQSAPTAQPIQVTVENITVPAGEDAGKWMRAAGHDFGLGMQAALLSQGAPL